MLQKPAIKKIYETLDTENYDKHIKSLTEYHEVRGNWGCAEEMRALIHRAAWTHLSEEQRETLEGLSDEVEGITGDTKNAADNAIQDLTTQVLVSHYLPRIGAFELRGIRRYVDIDIVMNTCQAVAKDDKGYKQTLLARWLTYMFENEIDPPTCGQSGDYRVANIANYTVAINELLVRVLIYEDIPIFSVDHDELSYYKPQHKPKEDGEFPTLKKWFGSLSDGDAYAAWLWGAYTCQYKGRRVPYLVGSSEKMKSLLQNTLLRELFGNAFVSISSGNVSGKNQFFMKDFEKAALAIIPDCQLETIYMTEWLKELSGGDALRIEGKGDPEIRSVVLMCKLFIMSNKDPVFSSEGFAMSRAMVIRMGNADIGFIDNPLELVQGEIPGFLHYAKTCYDKLVTKDYYIELNETTLRYAVEISDEFESEWQELILENFVINEKARVRVSDVREITHAAASHDKKYAYRNFRNFLNYKYNLRAEKVGGIQYVVGMGNQDDMEVEKDDTDDMEVTVNSEIFFNRDDLL